MFFGSVIFMSVIFVVTANDVENWSAPLMDMDRHHCSLVRQADVDNHNLEGGFWVVSDGCVYDVSHVRRRLLPQQVEQCIRKCMFTVYDNNNNNNTTIYKAP